MRAGVRAMRLACGSALAVREVKEAAAVDRRMDEVGTLDKEEAQIDIAIA